ncbi:hypothetical protein ABPG72_000599 [Tetrahymena utriculariae]
MFVNKQITQRILQIKQIKLIICKNNQSYMLQSNQNIFNQQVQQQRLSQCHYDAKLELQANLSANKPAKKLNVVQLDLQKCQLPQLNQARLSWLQEQFQNLVQCQNKWQSEIHQLPQQRAQTSCHGDKENMQSFAYETQPRSKTPFKMKESSGKYYEREVYSSLSKTRDTPHLSKKVLELNIEKQNDQIEVKRRQNKRQSQEQHHSNNSHSDIKKEKNKYNNFLGQYHVSQQYCNASSQQNKNFQQSQDKTLQKLSQAEIAQMAFQNSFLNIKQILSKNSATFNTEENEVIKTEGKEQQEYQKIKMNQQNSSKGSSLASLNSSVPLNSILKGNLRLVQLKWIAKLLIIQQHLYYKSINSYIQLFQQEYQNKPTTLNSSTDRRQIVGKLSYIRLRC